MANNFRFKIILYSYLIGVFLYFTQQENILKYFYYFIPFICFFVSNSGGRKFKTNKNLIDLFKLSLIIVLVNGITLVFNGLYIKFFQESFLWVSSIYVAHHFVINIQPDKLSNAIKQMFSGVAVTYIFLYNVEILNVLLNPSIFVSALLTSEVPTENVICYFFLVFAFYFFYKRDKLYFLLSILFMILSFKRLAILALVLGLFLYFILGLLKIVKVPKKYIYILTAFNLGFILIIFSLINGTFDDFIFDQFGVSSNFLFMGRVTLYTNILEQFKTFNMFIGEGMGRSAFTLDNLYESGDVINHNLHSDVLKLYLELGIILFIIYMFSFYKKLALNRVSFCLVIIINILLLIENVSIYQTFMTLFYVCIQEINSHFSSSSDQRIAGNNQEII